MRSVVYTKRGGMEAIGITESPTPQPGPGEVLVEVHRAGINFADLMMRQGLYSPAPDFPFTPGYEVSGIIRGLGEGVGQLGIGDRVVALCGTGGYSEQIALPADRCFPLPESVTFDSAAALPVTYVTALHMLTHLGNFRSGETILVHHAAGGVGTATGQLAKAKGKPARYPRAEMRREVATRYEAFTRQPRLCCDLAKADGRDRCYFHSPETYGL